MIQFLLGLVVVYFALRLAMRFLFPLLLKWWLARVQKRYYSENPSARPQENREEGEINIEYIPPHEDIEHRRPPVHSANSEDYVEFEEVETKEEQNKE